MKNRRFYENLFRAVMPCIRQIAPVGRGWHTISNQDPAQAPLLVDDNGAVIGLADKEMMDLTERVKDGRAESVSAKQIEALIRVICTRLSKPNTADGYPHRWAYRDNQVISCNRTVIADGLSLADSDRFIQEALRVWNEVLCFEAPLPTYDEMVFQAVMPVITEHLPADGRQWQIMTIGHGLPVTVVYQPADGSRAIHLAQLPQAMAEDLIERLVNEWAAGVSAALTSTLVDILIFCLERVEEYRGHPSRWQYHSADQTLATSADRRPVAIGLPQELLNDFLHQATQVYRLKYGHDEHTGLTFEPPRPQAIEMRIAELPASDLIPVLFGHYAPDVKLALQLLVNFAKLRREIVPFDLMAFFGGHGEQFVRMAFTQEYGHTPFMAAFEFLQTTGWVAINREEATAMLTSRALQRLEHFKDKGGNAWPPDASTYQTVAGPGSCTH